MAITDLFVTFRRAKDTLESRLKTLRADIEAKQRERDRIAAAPAARADVKAALGAYIATLGGSYTAALQSTVATLARQPQVLVGLTQSPGKLLRTPILGAAEPMADHLSAKALDSAFAALFGGALAQAVDNVVDAMPWPENAGLPMAERTPAIDRLTLAIEKLLAEEQSLLQEAEAAGLHIAPY